MTTPRTAEDLATIFADHTVTLSRVVATFQRWLHLPDATPLLASLGALAANLMEGDPCWLILVAPPSTGKTEILGSFGCLPYVHSCATLTEAALLSGSPDREKAAGAKGGLLREIGDFGIIVCKDFGSVINMQRDTQSATLAALREVYDGSWTRHVGTNGGRTLHWQGKVGMIAGCTPTIDRQHSVMASMGERFLLCRLPIADEDAQAQRALDHVGHEGAMRLELSNAVRDLFGLTALDGTPLEATDREQLINLATLVVRCRSAVERDNYSRDIELIPDAEAPGRFVTTIARLLCGLRAIGADKETCWHVINKVALDSMPALRWTLIDVLANAVEPIDTTKIGIQTGYPSTTTRRALEDLTAHGVVRRHSQGQGKADLWELSEWTVKRLAAVNAPTEGVPEIPETVINPHRINNGKSGKVPLQLDPRSQAYIDGRRGAGTPAASSLAQNGGAR